MGARYVLGFAPALRFSQSQMSQILCRHYKSHSGLRRDETDYKPAEVPRTVCIRRQKERHTHVKDHVVHV